MIIYNYCISLVVELCIMHEYYIRFYYQREDKSVCILRLFLNLDVIALASLYSPVIPYMEVTLSINHALAVEAPEQWPLFLNHVYLQPKSRVLSRDPTSQF